MTDKIVFTDGTVFDSASIISCTYTEQVNRETDICPGAACAAELEFQIRARYGAITRGAQFTYYKVSDTGAETKIGVFTVEKPEKDSPYTYTVLAYDNVSKTYKDASTWLRNHQEQFPLSLFSLVQTACSECGLTLANESLPNGDFQVQAFYADDLQWIQILQWAAQAACKFVRADAEGRIEFSWYEQVAGSSIAYTGSETYTGARIVSGYKVDTLTFEDYQTAVLDKVQIRQSDDDVGVIYPPDETKTNTYVISENMLLAPVSAEALAPIAEYVYNTLSEVQYTPGSVSLFPSLTYRAGDIVEIYPQDGDVIRFYVTTAKLSAAGVDLTSTGNASRDSSSAVNSRNYSNLQGRMLEISAGVKGLNVKASELSGNYSELKQTVEGFKTEVQETVSSQNERISTAESNYSSLSQTVSGLSSTVSSVKTTANNAASKADSAAAKADSALSDAKNYTDGKLVKYSTTTQMNSAIDQKASEITQTVSKTYRTEAQVQSAIDGSLTDYSTTAEMNSAIEQRAGSLKLSVERSGYFSVFEGTSWSNYTAGTFGNKITVNGVSGTAARLSTTDPDTLTYARGNTLHGSLSYRILTAIKGTSSSASFRFFLGVKYTDDTYTINDIIYDQGKKTIAAAGRKTTVSLDVSVADKEISLIYLAVEASRCSGVIEVGEVWANVAELNGKASTLTLTADGTKISSANIVMKGAVSFEDLSGAGRTTINGANVTTGIIRNAAGTTEYNLDSGTIRMGGSSGNRVYIDSDKIEWYGGNASGGGTGAGTIRNGLTTGTAGDTCVIGADTRYQKYGWYHGGNFQGITVEQVDNEVSVSGKLSVNQAVSCRTLKAWDAKERVVRTPLGNLQMNAMESPEPLFWDVGSGVCDSTGVCWIALRPEYAETISRRAALRWVVTPTGGAGNLWVEKLDSGALVHGGSGQRFDWACAGVQRGFEGCYAEGDPGRYPVPENPGDWLLTAAMDEAAVDLPLTI